MSIIVTDGYRQTGEVEFEGRHPDIFSTYLAANLIKKLAETVDDVNSLRADINIQSLGREMLMTGVTPIEINVGGQLTIPKGIYLRRIVYDTAVVQLEKAGYFSFGDFTPENVTIHTEGITRQSPNLHKTTKLNKFADSSVMYGHYLAPPFGIDGTFPSLIIGQKISRLLETLQNTTIPDLRQDGKVHVTTAFSKSGYEVQNIYLSIAHKKNIPSRFKQQIKNEIINSIKVSGVDEAMIEVNAGGDFDVYFLQADFGASKSKDDVIITGGMHQLGTDRVWGKCLFKASSTIMPYAFAISRALCEILQARFASVCIFAKYGNERAEIRLESIDPALEKMLHIIEKSLKKIPSDRDSIRSLLGLDVSVESYKLFNDVAGFHDSSKPWKRRNNEVENLLKKWL